MKFNITALFSLTIAASILLSGVHAKDLPAISTQARNMQATVKKTAKDDAGSSPTYGKVSGEVHNHVERQTLKSALKAFGDQNMQADARHLKRQHHQARRAQPRGLRGAFGLLARRAVLLGA